MNSNMVLIERCLYMGRQRRRKHVDRVPFQTMNTSDVALKNGSASSSHATLLQLYLSRAEGHRLIRHQFDLPE